MRCWRNERITPLLALGVGKHLEDGSFTYDLNSLFLLPVNLTRRQMQTKAC